MQLLKKLSIEFYETQDLSSTHGKPKLLLFYDYSWYFFFLQAIAEGNCDRVSSYTFRGNYSFLHLWILANSNSCRNISMFLFNKMKFWYGDYSRAETIWVNTVPKSSFYHAKAIIYSIYLLRWLDKSTNIDFSIKWSFTLILSLNQLLFNSIISRTIFGKGGSIFGPSILLYIAQKWETSLLTKLCSNM